MSKDLRTFLERLEKEGQVLRIPKQVDPKKEMSALIWQILPEKAAFFEKLTGYPDWRAAAGTIETRERVALVLGVSPKEVLPHHAKITSEGLIKPEFVNDGPVKEVIWKRDKVDLNKLPIPINCQRDAGPYLTFSETISKDPDTGRYNAAISRVQIKSEKKAGVYWIKGRHTWQNYLKYEKLNEPMPVAFVIGHHPGFHMAGTWYGAYDIDEYDVAGGIMGEPLPVVKCETIDLNVPAYAEAIIEGEVPPGLREKEGPFAEFTGYYSGSYEEPIVNVKAITMRKDPIYEFTYGGHWAEYASIGMCQYLYRRIKEVEGYIDLKDVHMFPQVDSFLVVVQFTPHYEGQAKNVLMAALSGASLHPKIAIAVDEDVNIYNPADVWWAVANRTNPEKDVFIVGNTRNHPFDWKIPRDPSAAIVQRVGSKMGIDATKPPSSKPEARMLFDRARPVGWGKVMLADFL